MALPPRITPAQLADALASPSPPVVLDGTWYMPAAGGGAAARAAFEAGPRIQGSLFFDVDAVTDTSTDLPHMLPPPPKFAAVADALGVALRDTGVAVYDRAGIFSAPRVWWTFRAMGHDNVTVLDGGLPAWIAAGLPVEDGPPPAGAASAAADAAAAADGGSAPPPSYLAAPRPDLVRDVDAMKANCSSRTEAVLDARPAARFAGAAPEPRPGVVAGHIPGSASLPYADLLTPDGGLRPDADVRAALVAAGWRPRGDSGDGGPANVATCGSGVTASVLAWAAATVGLDDRVAVYDGSWSEWGARSDTPKETG